MERFWRGESDEEGEGWGQLVSEAVSVEETTLRYLFDNIHQMFARNLQDPESCWTLLGF